jgi:hypothetical protein
VEAFWLGYWNMGFVVVYPVHLSVALSDELCLKGAVLKIAQKIEYCRVQITI